MGQVAFGPGEHAERPTTDERIRAVPGYGALKTTLETFVLGLRVLRLAARPPFSWFGDAVREADRYLRRCLIPLAISQAIWYYGFGVIIFAKVAVTLGIADRFPGGTYTGYVREVSTWITLMIFAGIAGSAVAADLGSRKIREELDALAVLGVDRLRTLIVPRVVAMIFCAVVLGYIGLLIPMGVVQLLASPDAVGLTPEVFRASWYLDIHAMDLVSMAVKHTVMGFFLALVACQRGLATKGGAEGVGRTVTQTVVVSFFGIWLINSIYNLGYITLFPDLSLLRG